MNPLKYCSVFVFVLLAAHFSNATWLCQNNEGSVSGNSVSFSDESKSHGCIYNGYPITSGDHYFEIRVEDSGIDFKVGVTTDKALDSTPFKGFFYGVNLTDGSNVLRENFGDMVDLSDSFYTVGVIVRISSEKMDLYFIHANLPLGLAFSINTPPVPLFPAVIVKGNGNATLIPKSFSNELQLERWTHPIEGSYKLTLLKEGNTKKEIECLNDIIKLRSLYFGHPLEDNDNEEVIVSFNNGNPSGIIVKYFGKWQYQKQLYFGDSHESECIQFVVRVLENVVSFRNTNNKITIVSGNGSEEQRSFEAEKIKGIVPSPVTENVFESNSLRTV